MIDVNDAYAREVECEYKGEKYKVRDNGAICRMTREGKPKRAKDEIWTFGEKIDRGYAKFCGRSQPFHCGITQEELDTVFRPCIEEYAENLREIGTQLLGSRGRGSGQNFSRF